MNRYSKDYGVGWHGTAFSLRSKTPLARHRLTRAEAARVIAEPLPKRPHGHARAIARPLIVGLAIAAMWALAFIVAFAS